MIELQSHSTVSDGELAPAGVVQAAAEAGVRTLALTDHDSVDGIAEASSSAAELGVELVPAAEMSCIHAAIDDLHMLGYWIDPAAMKAGCERAQAERVTRAQEIVERLNSQGVPVKFEDVVEIAGDADSIGRPHIAKAAGTKPEEMGPFFEEWLIPGAKAFVPRRWPTAGEAVKMIHDAGGAAVLAHPFWDIDEPAEVQALIEDLEIEGVEVFYPSHDEEQTKFLVELCADRGLVTTASSDFHGPGHKMFASFGAYETFGLGEPAVPPKPS